MMESINDKASTENPSSKEQEGSWLARFRKRWHLESNLDFFLVLLSFSLAGMAVLRVRRFVFALAGIGESTPFILKFLLWLAVVFPSYYCLLFIIGSLLGQYQFVKPFAQRGLGRIFPFLKEQHSSEPIKPR